MRELLFLSPYPKLSDLASEVLSLKNVDYEIIDIPSLQSEQAVKELDKTARVIVSRGGVAKTAKLYTNLPVIEIPVTLFDILDACNAVANVGTKGKAIITSANIIYNQRYINRIKDMNIEFVSSDNWIDERIQAEEMMKSGVYDVIIGDALSYDLAQEYGLHATLIESSKESINLAVEEALRIVAPHRLDHQQRIKSRKEILEQGWVANYTFRDILGQSEELVRIVKLAQRFAKSESNVLITGETGTGKEMFAQSIHNASDRVYGPFVSVNCGAINDNLFESELFGYDGGAFTGAHKDGKKGLFECANRGTIFLDEISETSLSAQAKLLRVLQEKEIRRVGSEKVFELDARIICATNKNLVDLVSQGLFRRDLYYRLSELELLIPPLRDRQEDIVLIAKALVKKEANRNKKDFYWKDRAVFNPLRQYQWPGNVRELRNFIVKLVTYLEEQEITGVEIDYILRLNNQAPLPATLEKRTEDTKISVTVSRDLKIIEREVLVQLLRLYSGDKEKLCRDYGISRMTLWRKLNYKNDTPHQS